MKLQLQGNVPENIRRVKNMPVSGIVYKAFCMLKRHNDLGKDTWLSTAMNVFNSSCISANMSFDVFRSKPEPYIKTYIKNKLQKSY